MATESGRLITSVGARLVFNTGLKFVSGSRRDVLYILDPATGTRKPLLSSKWEITGLLPLARVP